MKEITKNYLTTVKPFPGSDYREINHWARAIYKQIVSKSKRKPYVRSAYFDGEKVFLDYFWQHLQAKNWRDRTRRLKYYLCAIDLIKNNRFDPIERKNPNDQKEILYRFSGVTKSGSEFFVQLKVDLKTGNRHFMSVFPA